MNFPARCRTAAALLLLMVSAACAQTLDGFTEEWPPYNFAESGAIKGISTEVFAAVCADAKLTCRTRLVPWARAQKIVSISPNTVLFSTARLPARENDFLWVGPLLPRITWVYVKAAQGLAKPLPDIRLLRFGIVREEAAQEDLLQAGVPAASIVEDTSNAAVLRLLMAGAIDAMVDTEIGMDWNLRHANLPPGAVSRVARLSVNGAYYFAVNTQTDPAVVHSMQTSLDKLRRLGRLQSITQKYSRGR
nr:transporter substrate-binding domain-containing protein [uncultured Rhodoferax sp.]